MSNVLLTDRGMDFVTSAHDNGIFVDVRFFVPVYDDRIDPTVRDTLLSAYSEIADATANSPVGEILWQQQSTSGYALSDNDTYIISASEWSSPTMTDSYQYSKVQTNLFSGTPLSDQISASTWASPSGPVNGLYTWSATGGTAVAGSNSRPTSTSADFFRVTDYYPVYDTSAQENMRGSFKCVIDDDIGNVKFNKIALYAASRNNSGLITGWEFFGEAYLENPAVRSNLGVGFDRFEFDIQVDISGTSASFEDVFFSSSADYWSQSPGGLYYPCKIGVGEFVDNHKAISATGHFRKPRASDGNIDTTIPNLRLDYDNDKYMAIDADGNQHDVTSWSGGTDITLSLASLTAYNGDAISIHPKVKSTIALGTTTYPFRELHIESSAPDVGSKSVSGVQTLTVINGYGYAANINNGSVQLGSSVGVSGTISDDPFGIKINGLGINILSGTEQYGVLKRADLHRPDSSLIMYTSYNGSVNTSAKIYLVAGVNEAEDYSIFMVGQDGLTHKNLLAPLSNTDLYSYYFSNDAEAEIVARGGLTIKGPMLLENMRDTNVYAHNDALIWTKKNVMFLVGGAKSTADADDFNGIYNAGSNFANFLNSDTSASKVVLVGKEIVLTNDTVPWLDSTYALGSSSKRYSCLYAQGIDTSIQQSTLDSIATLVKSVSSVSYMGAMAVLDEVDSYGGGYYNSTTYLMNRGDLGSVRNVDGSSIEEMFYLGHPTLGRISHAYLSVLDVDGKSTLGGLVSMGDQATVAGGLKSGSITTSDSALKWKVYTNHTFSSSITATTYQIVDNDLAGIEVLFFKAVYVDGLYVYDISRNSLSNSEADIFVLESTTGITINFSNIESNLKGKQFRFTLFYR